MDVYTGVSIKSRLPPIGGGIAMRYLSMFSRSSPKKGENDSTFSTSIVHDVGRASSK